MSFGIYGVSTSPQINYINSTGCHVLANEGAKKSRISFFGNGEHAFAAVMITKEMSIFRKFLLSFTHTRVNVNGQEFFFNDNSFKKRLSVFQFKDMLTFKQSLTLEALKGYFRLAENMLVAEKGLIG